MRSKFCLARTRNERGTTVTEFSFILPLVVVVIGALTDMSNLLIASPRMQEAASAAARKAVVIRALDVTAPSTAHYIQLAGIIKDRLALLNPGSYSVSLSGPADLPDDQTSDLMVKIAVNRTFHLRFLALFGMESISFKRESIMRYEWQ